MKQMTRAAALSLAIAGILTVSLNVRTVSASETLASAKPSPANCVPPTCNPGGQNGCGIFNGL